MTIALTHPEKIMYAQGKVTKEEVFHYYEQVAPLILPYLSDRPLTIVRCPNGIDKCFFQKHITDSTPDSLHGIMIKDKEGKSEYFYINDTAGLLSLAQYSALELHPWGSHVKTLEYPDIIIFDLDPAPDVPWKKVVAGAKLIKAYLAEYKLKAFVKTTGGKGLHVIVPIKPEYDWDEVKNFAHVFVDLMVEQHPKDYVGQMTKSKRTGKIFLDYLRNGRGATAVAAYSTRARPFAPISTPLEWDELSNNAKDNSFTIKTILQRLDTLKKDPWQNFFKIRQSLRLDINPTL